MSSIIGKRKIKIFFSQKRAWVGLILFLILFFSSIFANIISNNKPIFLVLTIRVDNSVKSKVFFPIFFHYEPIEFGIEDSFIINYKELVKNQRDAKFLFPFNMWDAEEQTEDVLAAPSKTHFLGTDNLGRDIFARLIYGVRLSLAFGLILWFISFSVGIIIGAAQGYFLGSFDFLLERFKELSAVIPTLTLVILVTAITNQQSFSLILFMVLIFAWMGIASQIRASVLSLSRQDFCEAARALGASHKRIILKHILSNSLVPIITLSPFAIEGGISLLAALDYLGFGLPPPTPSLGELMAQGRDTIQNAPWVLISPIIVILLLLVSINLVGQSLRDAYDPKA
jgi:microcin C transport system permease protein